MPPAGNYRPPSKFGNYDVHELLGRGGMATVYRGEHRLLQRQVAIKFLHGNIARRERERQRFLREARLVAKLAHPNIVTVFDFGELDDGVYYQASELVGGTTLRDLLRERSLSIAEALGFARQIALGLASAHALGIIHRDLKPSNVMVAPDPTAPGGLRLKILDFGIAKSLDVEPGHDDGVTKTGIVIGTPGYMAPEQCVGSTEIGLTADIYSFGVVLYAMICGRRPFDGDAARQLQLHVKAAPPRPSELVPECSPLIDALVVRCLAKAPRDRPQQIVEVIAELDRELGVVGEPVAPVRPSAMALALDQGTVRLATDAPLVRLATAPEPTEHTGANTLDRAIVTTTTAAAPHQRRWKRMALLGGPAIVILAVVAFVARGRDNTAPTPARDQGSVAPAPSPPAEMIVAPSPVITPSPSRPEEAVVAPSLLPAAPTPEARDVVTPPTATTTEVASPPPDEPGRIAKDKATAKKRVRKKALVQKKAPAETPAKPTKSEASKTKPTTTFERAVY